MKLLGIGSLFAAATAAAATVLLLFADSAAAAAAAVDTAEAVTTTTTTYTPIRVEYGSLLLQQEDDSNTNDALQVLQDALQDIGMVSLTGLKDIDDDDFRAAKQEMLRHWSACTKSSQLTKQHVFFESSSDAAGGETVVRSTMATHTTYEHGMGVMEHYSSSMGDSTATTAAAAACLPFDAASTVFRREVDRILETVMKRLSYYDNNSNINKCDGEDNEQTPLLYSLSNSQEDGDSNHYQTLADVVQHGEHLEHFHEYTTTTTMKKNGVAAAAAAPTIEWHTDQGLFLAFMPGIIVSSRDDDNIHADTTASNMPAMHVSDGFYIELPDGTRPMVDFDLEADELVLLVGDGMMPLMENNYRNSIHCVGSDRRFRPLPHALVMPDRMMMKQNDDDVQQRRLWYGRMVLPPANALHPHFLDGDDGKQTTFGMLRDQMIEASHASGSDHQPVMALGCSGPNQVARQLEESSCEEGTLYCWHRCMSLEEAGVSADSCAEQDLDLWCINPRNQLWDNSHGDWFPGCIDAETAESGTPFPPLPNYPRDDTTCTDEAHAAFVERIADQYDFSYNLTNGGTLYWSVIEDLNDGDSSNTTTTGAVVIDGMLTYNGLLGYLGFGFAGSPEERNAMTGALVMMAVPSASYNASGGFDFSDEDVAEPIVTEHFINAEKGFAFRHWQTPVEDVNVAIARNSDGEEEEAGHHQHFASTGTVVSDISTYVAEEVDDCFSSVTFRTVGIFDRAFNVSGTDRMIWAANGEDMFAGYHGSARGVMTVDWSTGTVTLKGDEEEEDEADAAEEEEDEADTAEEDEDSSSVRAKLVLGLASAGVAVAVSAVLL